MGNKKKKTNDILKQGLILAAASILVRMVGLLYRIPLGNQLGEEGNGIYSIAYKVYSIALIISSYGLPLAVSKMVAEKSVKREYRYAHRIFINALIFAVVIGGIVGGIVYLGADFFATALGSANASMPLRVLAPTIFFVAVLGVFRGFFQGQNTMIPTAVSQIVEQIMNAVVSIAAAYSFMEMHKTADNVAAYGATGSTWGTFFGAVSALVFMIGVYFLNRPIIKKRVKNDVNPIESNKVIYQTLFMTVVPVILSQTVYQLSGVIELSLFGNVMKNVLSEEIREGLIGVYSGQYTLLINVPLGVATAMGTSMIPSITASVTNNDMNEVREKVRSVIKFNMLIAFPSAVGLAVLGGPINKMLFYRLADYQDVAKNLMLYGSVALVFFALSTVSSGVLQSISKMRLPVIHSGISLGIYVVIVYLLLKFTNLSIYALMIGNIVFPMIVSILNWRAVGKYIEYKQEVKTTFLLPALSSLIMGVVCIGGYQGSYLLLKGVCGARLGNAISTLIAVCIAVFVYFVALLLLKTVDEVELKAMPMGRKLYVLGHKLHLI